MHASKLLGSIHTPLTKWCRVLKESNQPAALPSFEGNRDMDVERSHGIQLEHVLPSHETSVDWRGRSCKANKHGGLRAALFVLGFSTHFHFIWISHLTPWIYIAFCRKIEVFLFILLEDRWGKSTCECM